MLLNDNGHMLRLDSTKLSKNNILQEDL